MKKTLIALVATVAATSAFADDHMAADADGNGTISLAEFQAVNPDMTAEQFAVVDVDGNGEADADEVAAAIAAGVLTH